MSGHITTLPVVDLQWRFFEAAMQIPAARQMLSRLQDPHVLDLAKDCFAISPNGPVSPALAACIEKVLVDCHLAVPPAHKSWAFGFVVRSLASYVQKLQEPRENGPEDVSFFPIVFGVVNPSTLGLSHTFVYQHPAWDPTLEPWAKYHKQCRGDFESQLKKDMRDRQSVYRSRGLILPPTRGDDQLKWLVRYQILDESFEIIAATCGSSVSAETVKAAVLRLRDRLALLKRRPRGRPRK
jgi:hypothetical protein